MLEGVISRDTKYVPLCLSPSLSGPAIDLRYLPPYYIPSKVGLPHPHRVARLAFWLHFLNRHQRNINTSEKLSEIVKFFKLYKC